MHGRPTTKRKKDDVENQTRHSVSEDGIKGKYIIYIEVGKKN